VVRIVPCLLYQGQTGIPRKPARVQWQGGILQPLALFVGEAGQTALASLFVLRDLETDKVKQSFLCFSGYVISVVAMEMLCDGP